MCTHVIFEQVPAIAIARSVATVALQRVCNRCPVKWGNTHRLKNAKRYRGLPIHVELLSISSISMVNGIRGHLKMLASGRNGFTCEHTNSRAANALSLPLLLPLGKDSKKKMCMFLHLATLPFIYRLCVVIEIVWSWGVLCKALKGKTSLGPIAIGCTHQVLS